MTRAELVELYEDLVADGQAVISAVADGEYADVDEYEADVNAVRTRMAELVGLMEAEWGVAAVPAIHALRHLGVRLLALRAGIAPAVEEVDQVVDRETSLLELAVTWYADWTRWRELAALNPGLRHPGFVPAGSTVVRHAR